ncbi:MAG: LysR family transcriptional regulator [Betaproteobacteria bacterium]|uniref:LysR family transcriptional regulator n=1 Tax=Serpentinimonas maccroryi TaxID=1458426 RepID=UPI0020334417|nr:LysR family transcriptional regulator [Serpentinimonas maccroryi]MCL5967743.1 LysR family transcriptional regulator [Betaproteobacteria bacterium]MCM2478401.1 LysR family transcriptional regulator [Serpentinimonas maccroryi]
MIERTHLAILREVERTGSLTAAAQRLHLTQSALSHSMRKLEDRFGTPIWRREGRRLIPTQAGQYLLNLAQRLLPQLEHAEQRMQQFARGERGSLRVGMECHPCYLWLMQYVAPYLARWPDVDLDVKQKFEFGGIGALFAHDIDVLVTPDPHHKPGLHFEPVHAYEQVLVLAQGHALAQQDRVQPQELSSEVLLTYPVPPERLDVYSQFLTPAGVAPRLHKTVENTEVLLQLVASGRGVTALPLWVVQAHRDRLPIVAVRLGARGIQKHIHLGLRSADLDVPYVNDLLALVRQGSAAPPGPMAA